jgi:Protein of unknown function (DUF669)
VSFADAWKRAGTDDFDPPDGEYTVKIADATAFAGNDGREWCKITLEILQGEHAGRQFADFMNLNNEVGLRIAREHLSLYGLDAAALEEEGSTLEDLNHGVFELVDTVADVTVRHKNGYLNLTVTGSRTSKSDIPSDPATSNAGARFGDDVPWE